MQSLRFKTLLQSVSLFILSVVLVPVQAVAAEPADEKAVTSVEVDATTTETSPDTWDKTREVSGDAWDATKEGSAKAWEKTREVSGEVWDATKEGSAKAWDKTRELTQPDAEETIESPQPDPQGTQP